MAEHNGAQHWDHVDATKHDRDLSWHQQAPATSLRLIGPVAGSLLDVGAGASTLPDQLLAHGCQDLTLIDVSSEALARTRRQLGPLAKRVCFVVKDLLTRQPNASQEVWHDRAVLHFPPTRTTAPATSTWQPSPSHLEAGP